MGCNYLSSDWARILEQHILLFGFAGAIKSSWIRTLGFWHAWEGSVLSEQWLCWWATVWTDTTEMIPCRISALLAPPAQICLVLIEVWNPFFWTSSCWFSTKPQFFQVQNTEYNKLHICLSMERCNPKPLEMGRAYSALSLSSINPHI